MDAESCVIFRRMDAGFTVEVNAPKMDEKIPECYIIPSRIPGNVIAIEKLIEWFYINLDELMKSDRPLVRGTTMTVVELRDLISSAWSEDDYPFIIELMNKCHLIKIDNFST